MANDSGLGLEIVVRCLLDARGFSDLQAELKKTEAAHRAATPAVDDFTKALQNIPSQLIAMGTGLLAVGAALEFLKGSFMAAVEASRMLDQMRAANESLAGATADAREANEAWLRSVEEASGKTKEELVPSYIRLVAVTGSVSEAQRITQIAAGAAARGFGDLGQITQALIRYYETGQTQTRGFGAVLKALVGDAQDVGEGFDKLTAKFGDAGVATDNLGLKMDRLKTRWHEFKAEVGNVVASMVDGIAKGFNAIDDFMSHNFKTALGGINDVTGASAAAATGLNNDCAKIKGGIDDANKSLKDFQEQYDDWALSAKNASKSVVGGVRAEIAVYKQMAADPDVQGLMSDKEKTKLNAKLIALEKQLTDAVKSETHKRAAMVKDAYDTELLLARANGVSQYAVLNAELDIYKRMATASGLTRKEQAVAIENVTKTEKALNAELEKERKVLTEGMTLRQFMDKTEEERMAKVRKDTAERIKLSLMEAKQLQKMDEGELQSWKKKLEAELSLEGITAEQIIAIRQKMTAITEQLDNDEVSNRKAAEQSMMTIATSVFGQNKALAVAQAVINTAEGATAIWGQGPEVPYYLKVVEEIAEIAAGGAQIANIESATPGSRGGFDNPSSDYAAYIGGQKWAGDMVRNYSSGAEAGWSAGMARGGSSSVVNNSSSVRYGDRPLHITIHGGILGNDDVSARLFVKRIAPYINRLDQRRNLQ